MLSDEPSEPVTDTLDPGRLPARLSRLFDALLADLKIVDCGSLDVLVYCRDDLVTSAGGQHRGWRPAASVDGP